MSGLTCVQGLCAVIYIYILLSAEFGDNLNTLEKLSVTMIHSLPFPPLFNGSPVGRENGGKAECHVYSGSLLTTPSHAMKPSRRCGSLERHGPSNEQPKPKLAHFILSPPAGSVPPMFETDHHIPRHHPLRFDVLSPRDYHTASPPPLCTSIAHIYLPGF